MALRHLTEEELQAYLESKSGSQDVFFDNHINTCHTCYARMQQYQVLFQGLKSGRGYDLQPGFSDAVVTRIAAAECNYSPYSVANMVAVVLGFTIIACLAAYFIDLKSLAIAMADPFALLFSSGSSLLADAHKIISQSSATNTGVYIFTGLILLTVSLTDYLIFYFADRKLCL